MKTPPSHLGTALAILELESISRGIRVADAVVKKAAIQWVKAEAVSPGKYLLIFSGDIAEVEASFAEGVELSGSVLLDKLFLPHAAPGLLDCLLGHISKEWNESLGIVETHSAASAVLAADSALKATDVQLKEMHLATGIGGKGYFTLSGALHQVEAALECAAAALPASLLVATELIQNPHPELRGVVL